MIYTSDDELIDCEYIRQKKLVQDFHDKFYTEVDTARARNFTTPLIVPQHSKPLISNHDFREFIENGVVTSEMEELRDNLEGFSSNAYAGEVFGMRNLTYTKLNDLKDVPSELRKWLSYHQLKEQCDNRHRQMKKIVHKLHSEDPAEKKAAKEHLERYVVSDILIF